MGTQALTVAKKFETLKELLGKARPQLAAAMPKHMGGVARFERIALTALQKQPELLDCAPITFVGSLIQSAQLGLEVSDGTGKAWLVPFNNSKKGRKEVQLIIGYRGMVDLARRGMPAYPIEARVVCKGDKFRYQMGTKPAIEHVPAEIDGAEPTHFYAVARFPNGTTQFDVMTKAQVDKIRARAKSQGIWSSDYVEMGKKTVVRRICKLLPCSVELLRAIDLDERAEAGKPQDIGTVADGTELGTVFDAELVGGGAEEAPEPTTKAAPARIEGPDPGQPRGKTWGEKLWNAINDHVQGDGEEAQALLAKMTAFPGKDNKMVSGVSDYTKLGETRAQKSYERFQHYLADQAAAASQ